MDLKRPMYPPGHPKGPTSGKDVQIMKWAIHRYETGLLPRPESGFTDDFGAAMKEALVRVIQPAEGISPTGAIGQATFDVLWTHLDDYRRRQYRLWTPPPPKPKPKPMPDLGPLCPGDGSILSQYLTHATDGMPGDDSDWPAFDAGWIGGRTVLAVENLTVTDDSGAAGGDAFFAKGASGIRYWYGHLQSAPAVGRTFRKGDAVGRIAYMSRAHVHLAVRTIEAYGFSMRYGATGHGPDYTYGSPSIGTQLREVLSLAA